MTKKRIGRQTPTQSVVLPYSDTKGQEAIDLYNKSSRKAREWQEILIYDIMARNDDDLWVHTKFGYELPRRNGKGEIIVIREIWGLVNGERILHTAHRTPTSHSAWERLCTLLDECKIEYHATKQFGLETIRLENGGYINFRTRSSKGGLGEGYDLLIIDEAQEYTIDQESALKYVVTDSDNPQTLMCGTPPTAVSAGTVFVKMREAVLRADTVNQGWAEWSVEKMTDAKDTDAWYLTNPSLGQGLTERAIYDEITSDDIDFNIQRLGLWLKYNQKSAISENEWNALKCEALPKFTSRLFVGIKFGRDGKNVAMSIAVKTKEKKIFVEVIDCRPVRAGNLWILEFLKKADIAKVCIDGANGQQSLKDQMKDFKLKSPILPTVKEIITANSDFEQGIYEKNICHNAQPSLVQAVSNCEKRAIGTNGGFGYKAQKEEIEIALMDSMILSYWMCLHTKEAKKQRIAY